MLRGGGGRDSEVDREPLTMSLLLVATSVGRVPCAPSPGTSQACRLATSDCCKLARPDRASPAITRRERTAGCIRDLAQSLSSSFRLLLNLDCKSTRECAQFHRRCDRSISVDGITQHAHDTASTNGNCMGQPTRLLGDTIAVRPPLRRVNVSQDGLGQPGQKNRHQTPHARV